MTSGESPKRGRKPSLPLDTLLERRSALAQIFERHWPEFSAALKQRRSELAVAHVFQKRKGMVPPFAPEFFDDPFQFKKQLAEFLASGRLRGNPRHLAGAMAGLPEMSWKRSFDLCTSKPLSRPLHENAILEHMRHRFPTRWAELKAAKTEADARRILAKTQTDDPTYIMLRANPKDALRMFLAGKPTTGKKQKVMGLASDRKNTESAATSTESPAP